MKTEPSLELLEREGKEILPLPNGKYACPRCSTHISAPFGEKSQEKLTFRRCPESHCRINLYFVLLNRTDTDGKKLEVKCFWLPSQSFAVPKRMPRSGTRAIPAQEGGDC